jgi:hypothetical protein
MKVKKILKEMYAACINGDTAQEKILWMKALKKSLKRKKTQAIR